MKKNRVSKSHIFRRGLTFGLAPCSIGVLLVTLIFTSAQYVSAQTRRASVSEPEGSGASPKATTSVVNVQRGSSSVTGSLGLLTFRVAHDILAPLSAGERIG